MHCVLIKYHPMLSADGHSDLLPTPAGPVPNPYHPHIVAHILWGWTLGDIATRVQAMGIEVIRMGSDIANGIPHVPMPPTHFLLFALYTAFSGSKSHFGPAAVQAQGKPVGAALLFVVNPNLNCYDVVPLPVGWTCSPNTVMVSMSFGDILGGLFALVTDAVLQAIINKVTGGVGADSSNLAVRMLAGPLVGFMVGSPLGKSSLDVVKAICPSGWSDTLDTLSLIPGFPGWAGTWSGHYSDFRRSIGQGIGDGVQSGVGYVFGSDGAEAASTAPGLVTLPATGTTPTPMDGVTNNPSVEEF
jgi:hypothetical protein